MALGDWRKALLFEALCEEGSVRGGGMVVYGFVRGCRRTVDEGGRLGEVVSSTRTRTVGAPPQLNERLAFQLCCGLNWTTAGSNVTYVLFRPPLIVVSRCDETPKQREPNPASIVCQ